MEDEAEPKILELQKEVQKTHKNYTIDFKLKVVALIKQKLSYHYILSNIFIKPLTSPWEWVTVFTSPYLSAGAPAQGEAKGSIKLYSIILQ